MPYARVLRDLPGSRRTPPKGSRRGRSSPITSERRFDSPPAAGRKRGGRRRRRGPWTQQAGGQAEAWRKADPDPVTGAELRRRRWRDGDRGRRDLADRFAGALEFGTAGLRGVMGAGPNRMNRAVVRRTTAGLARYLKATCPDVATRGVVIGRDGRRMSAEFAEDTAARARRRGHPGATSSRPLAPTPVTAFAALQLERRGRR